MPRTAGCAWRGTQAELRSSQREGSHLLCTALGFQQAQAVRALHVGEQLLVGAPHKLVAQAALGWPSRGAAGVVALLPLRKLALQLAYCHPGLGGHLHVYEQTDSGSPPVAGCHMAAARGSGRHAQCTDSHAAVHRIRGTRIQERQHRPPSLLAERPPLPAPCAHRHVRTAVAD